LNDSSTDIPNMQSCFTVRIGELWYNFFAMNVKKLVKPNIYSLKAYQAKDIPCRVKLDANESPYGFADSYTVVKSVKTNRYPDPEAKTLRRLLAKELGIRPGNILQGNGSDELIYCLITAFGGPVLYPVPTFSMYGIISQALGEKGVGIPLEADFDLDGDRMAVAMRKDKPKLVFLSSPNNPTGNCFSSEKILQIIASTSSKSLVVVDEAYHPFASKKGFLPLLGDYRNLVILRTLSKIGLAGLRVGFLIGDEEIIEQVNKVRLPFNLNALSQAVAAEVMKRRALRRQHIRAIVKERKRLFSALSKVEGVTAYPSEANFILFRVQDAQGVYQGLLDESVLVRDMKGLVEGCLRVTIGTPDENRIFLRALKKVLRSKTENE
jgi:histidinol-phosphate aminotransferase